MGLAMLPLLIVSIFAPHPIMLSEKGWRLPLRESTCNITAIHASELTPEKFRTLYDGKEPVLIQSATLDWPAHELWSKPYMIKRLEHLLIGAFAGFFTVVARTSPHPVKMQWRDFMSNIFETLCSDDDAGNRKCYGDELVIRYFFASLTKNGFFSHDGAAAFVEQHMRLP